MISFATSAEKKKKKVYGKQLYGKCVSCSCFEKSILAIRFKAGNCGSRAKLCFKSWVSQLNQQIWRVDVKYFVRSLFFISVVFQSLFLNVYTNLVTRNLLSQLNQAIWKLCWSWKFGNISFAGYFYLIFSIFVFKDVTFNLQYKKELFFKLVGTALQAMIWVFPYAHSISGFGDCLLSFLLFVIITFYHYYYCTHY